MNKKLPNPLPENTPGQRILKLRLGAGLTLEQLAERLDFTANYFGPHACGTAENLESLSENQASLAAFIKNCSEEEFFRFSHTQPSGPFLKIGRAHV